jgi:glycosyltransferase involved in cell wall biosynthesis
MLSRDLGGIQQAFLDYSTALKLRDFEVINVTSTRAKINQSINSDYQLANLGVLDIFSTISLRRIIKKTTARIILCHGNRAMYFANKARISSTIMVGIAHNYTLKGLRKCDKIIALTEHMQEFLINNGFESSQICIIPNMIDTDMIDIAAPTIFKEDYRNPIIIGAIARFVPKKGIDIFVQSLAELRKQRYNFRAIIAGDGEEREKIQSLAKNLGLESMISFVGWIKDKQQFFNSIDIFCLPSTHEPFGIIILEAMKFGVAIISTKTEGPKEIIRDKIDGLLCDIGSSSDLSNKIAYLIDHPQQAQKMVRSSYLRLTENYQTSIVTVKLADFIRSLA